MTKDIIISKIKELSENKDFIDQLNSVATVEEMSAVLKEFGLDLPEDDLAELLSTVPVEGELSEDDLGTVSGGLNIKTIAALLAPLLKPIPLTPIKPTTGKKKK